MKRFNQFVADEEAKELQGYIKEFIVDVDKHYLFEG